jgi:hypothetical protein
VVTRPFDFADEDCVRLFVAARVPELRARVVELVRELPPARELVRLVAVRLLAEPAEQLRDFVVVATDPSVVWGTPFRYPGPLRA